VVRTMGKSERKHDTIIGGSAPSGEEMNQPERIKAWGEVYHSRGYQGFVNWGEEGSLKESRDKNKEQARWGGETQSSWGGCFEGSSTWW